MFSDGHQCQADNTEGNYWRKNEVLRAVDEGMITKSNQLQKQQCCDPFCICFLAQSWSN